MFVYFRFNAVYMRPKEQIKTTVGELKKMAQAMGCENFFVNQGKVYMIIRDDLVKGSAASVVFKDLAELGVHPNVCKLIIDKAPADQSCVPVSSII